MTPGQPAPQRLAIRWLRSAKADVRAIDRDTAMAILRCIDRFLLNRSGNVKKLQPPETGLRLRCGEYRIFFEVDGDAGIVVTSVDHRREAYR